MASDRSTINPLLSQRIIVPGFPISAKSSQCSILYSQEDELVYYNNLNSNSSASHPQYMHGCEFYHMDVDTNVDVDVGGWVINMGEFISKDHRSLSLQQIYSLFMACLLPFLIAAIMGVVDCLVGLDLAGALTITNYQCIKNAGNSFVIVRAFASTGVIDPAATQSLTNAKAVGLATDVYMFPCRGKNAATQADQLIDGIPANLYTNIWIDVENNPSPGCSWASFDTASNCKFLTDIITRFRSYGKSVGVYSSTFMWANIFGGKQACPAVAAYPLWYAHYDNMPSFEDFSSFGGWIKPTVKQFAGQSPVCGFTVNRNYKF